MSNKRGFVITTTEIEGISYYNTNHLVMDTLLPITYKTIGNNVALVEILEKGFKVEKILNPCEFNDLLLKECISIFKNSDLILTGSLALHLYKPLNRFVNNVNVLCDSNNLRKLKFNIVPLDYEFCTFKDTRSWGYIYPYGIDILVKNNLSYQIINNIKVSNIDDIISSKIDLAIKTRNIDYLKDINDYRQYISNLNIGKYG